MAREEQGAPQAAEEPIDRELLEHYLAGAAEKLATLEEALASARAGDAGAGDAVRQALHKLADSAGTYGFTELGAQARPAVRSAFRGRGRGSLNAAAMRRTGRASDAKLVVPAAHVLHKRVTGA